MDTQKVETQFRLSGWGEAVKERIGSGQTVEAFCEEKGISKTTYYYRQKKVREAACSEMVRAQNHDRENKPVPSGWAQLAEAETAIAAESTGNSTQPSQACLTNKPNAFMLTTFWI